MIQKKSKVTKNPIKKKRKKSAQLAKRAKKLRKKAITPFQALAFYVNNYYDIQDLRIRTESRFENLKRDYKVPKNLQVNISKDNREYRQTEAWLKNKILKELDHYPVWTEWLKDIKGIGPCLAGGLIAWLREIKRFKTVSAVFRYCGIGMITRCKTCKKRIEPNPSGWINRRAGQRVVFLARVKKLSVKKQKMELIKWKKKYKAYLCTCQNPQPYDVIQKRTKGEESDWSSKLKTHCWKISSSFIKTKGGYRRHYDKVKAVIASKHSDFSKGHIDNQARRKTVQLFISHLFVQWNQLEGRPYISPYPIAKLGHTHYIAPFNS